MSKIDQSKVDEILSYMQKHHEKLGIELAAVGETTVPTSFGPFTFTLRQLEDAVAYHDRTPSFWKRALSIFKGEA